MGQFGIFHGTIPREIGGDALWGRGQMEGSCGGRGLQGRLANLFPVPPLQPQASCISSAASTLSPPSLSRRKTVNQTTAETEAQLQRPAALLQPLAGRPNSKAPGCSPHAAPKSRGSLTPSFPSLRSSLSPQLFPPSLRLHTASQGAGTHSIQAAFHFADGRTDARGGERFAS